MKKLLVIGFIVFGSITTFSLRNENFYTKYKSFDNGANSIFVCEEGTNDILIRIDSFPFEVSLGYYARINNFEITFDENGNSFALGENIYAFKTDNKDKEDNFSSFKKFNLSKKEKTLIEAENWFDNNINKIVDELFSTFE